MEVVESRASLLRNTVQAISTAFAGVPWVLEGFMKAWRNESDEAHSRYSALVGHLLVWNVI